MSIHLQREIKRIKRGFLSLSAKVEDNLAIAVQALLLARAPDPDLLERLDREIDRMEVELEEECLKLMALHQPVAGDLRLVVAVLKTNNDLERVGDIAVNIYNKARKLDRLSAGVWPFNLEAMSARSREMLHLGIQAFIDLDSARARQVCEQDSTVDEMKRDMRLRAPELLRTRPEDFELIYTLLGASRNLERVADHATNIAEDVIYLVDGRIVRHRQDND